ncbi:PAS domain S-box-containing protein [Sphingomonas zeicaulis]|uniref:sensor histidine kinase n=1 Tax=Sphingomonas zeicaulis TaxID=1632740 RepID=UPI003D24D5B8
MTSHEPSSQVREQPRAETDDIHRLILESVRDYAIFMTDADGLVQTWPPGAASVFGWTAEDMIGRSFELTFVPEDREQGIPQQEMEKALEIGATPNVRWHQRSDGERVFIEGSTQLLKRGEGSRHGFLKIGRDMTERRRMEQRQQVLVAELQHRTRNLMAVVQSIFNNTLRSSNTIADLAATYQDRLAALARVQGLLSRLKDGDRITFDELIRIELSAIGALAIGEAGSRATIEGPPGVRLRSSTVQTLALALHELATNAGKYGALSERGGHLHVRWSLPPGDRSLRVEWTESGVAIPNLEAARERQGHGRQLIERALPYQLQAETSFEIGADGVRCTIVLPVSQSTVQEGGGHD